MLVSGGSITCCCRHHLSRGEAGRDSPQSRAAGPRRRPSPVHFACSRAPQHPAARGTAGSGWAALPWGHRGGSGHRGVALTVPVVASRCPVRPVVQLRVWGALTGAPLLSRLSPGAHWEGGAEPVLSPRGTRIQASPLCPMAGGSSALRRTRALWPAGPLCGRGHASCSHLENEDRDHCASVTLRAVVSTQASDWGHRALGEAPENGVLSQHLCHGQEGGGAATREICAQAMLPSPQVSHCQGQTPQSFVLCP